MTLQVKMTSIIIALMLLLGIVYHVIERHIILPGYISLETLLAVKDIGRCRAAIEGEIRHLDSLVNDWAVWDDTYRFMVDRNDRYIQSNLVDDTFIDNRLNLIYYYNLQGKGIWGQGFDLKTGRTMSLPPFDQGRLDPSHPLLDHQSVKSRHAGLLQTPLGVILFSSRPIVTSNHQGPMRGTLIMGRLLSQADRATLVEQTGVQHKFWATNDENMPLDARSAIKELSSAKPFIAVEQGPHRLVVYDTMPDFKGGDALLLRCEMPGHIFAGGRSAMDVARIVFLSGMVMILIALVVVLQRVIVTPITQLKSHTMQIRRTQNMSLRHCMRGHDEIANLSNEFNRMVERLECYHERLRALSTRLLQTESQERRKLAAYLHDHIVQSMTIAKIKLDALALNANQEKWVRDLDDISGFVDESIQKARTMTFELSPQILYELGLAPALEWLADRFYRKHKLIINMSNGCLKLPLDDKLNSFLFQASREFLLNIVKHANADKVKLNLTVEDNRWVAVTVEDDGTGFSGKAESPAAAENASTGFGLFTIGETARHMGGELRIRPGPSGGTQVKLTMPLQYRKVSERNGGRS